jgi:multidrug efflux pump subunit AcrB
MRLYVRAPAGTRLEETARLFAEIQRDIRTIVPARDVEFIGESIGAVEPINRGWVDSNVIGSFDGELLMQLADGHAPTARYMASIRSMLAEKYPQVRAFFRPADNINQTLAGTSLAALDVRVVGRDVPGNIAAVRELEQRMRTIPGVVDTTMVQVLDLPEYRVEVDRVRAMQLGVTQQEAASAILNVLGTGGTVAPNLWADAKMGISYAVQLLAPPQSMDSMETLLNTPVSISARGEPVLLRNIASVKEQRVPGSTSRTTLAPTFNIVANVQGRDLGSVYREVEAVRAQLSTGLKPGNRMEIVGQSKSMRSAYAELASGIVVAAVLVFLVMVVNFQSWTAPLVALSGLPFALVGAALGLWVTATPLSVPALMGMIMVVGVSTANSVLVTSFALGRFREGVEAAAAAAEAAATRLRPVLMTASAMIIGILPMALGLGEGGEQNAPLGRAVVGGLTLGTIATLIMVPVVFALAFARRRPVHRNVEAGAAPSTAVS